jgi:HlyD family secretion protein
MKTIFLLVCAVLLLAGCKNKESKSDAFGNFEAIETIVSAENAGKLLLMQVKEGEQIAAGQLIALVDTIDLVLRKQQTLAQLIASETKKQNVAAQIDVLKEQQKNIHITRDRVAKMLADQAATQQQMDDINGQANVIEKQIVSYNTQNLMIASEMDVIKKQMDLLDEQLTRCRIISPVSGTVLETYLELGELATPGKPILKLADLSTLELKVYISGGQLSKVKLGNEVKVLIDSETKEMLAMTGKITWISTEAEFTPKIIQTKEERVKLMYAVKVDVLNDGRLKIGMPGEVVF